MISTKTMKGAILLTWFFVLLVSVSVSVLISPYMCLDDFSYFRQPSGGLLGMTFSFG